MHNKRNNLLTVLLLAGLVLMAGCPKKKTMPTVTISAPTGSVELMAGEFVNFTATLDNPDNVKTTVEWTAAGGTLAPDTGLAVKWTAPADSGHFTIYAVASGEGLTDKDTASKAALVRTWARGDAEIDNIGPVTIPAAPSTTTIGDTFPDPDGDPVPAGALVDSAIVENVDISFDGGSPDSTPNMNVWVQSPDGTQSKIWDETQGAFPADGVPFGSLVAFKDKTVTGVWSLIVTTTETNQIPGTIDDFDVHIYFRTAVP
jgi:hypothetical protein